MLKEQPFPAALSPCDAQRASPSLLPCLPAMLKEQPFPAALSPCDAQRASPSLLPCLPAMLKEQALPCCPCLPAMLKEQALPCVPSFPPSPPRCSQSSADFKACFLNGSLLFKRVRIGAMLASASAAAKRMSELNNKDPFKKPPFAQI